MTDPIYPVAGHYYLQRGFAPLPLPPYRKSSPPGGWTGADGAWPTPMDVQFWIDVNPAESNIGLRLPRNVVGIDVDDYAPKLGGQTLAELEATLGPLPATWRSSSRANDAVSGVRMYRLPDGADSSTFRDPGVDIETLRYEHRYMVAAPSIHPTGGVYRWYAPDGSNMPPDVASLPLLPPPWVEHLIQPAPDRVEHELVTVADIPAERLPAVAQWARAAIEGIIADLTEAKSWPEGFRDDKGRGWEKLTADKFLWAHRVLLAVRDVMPGLADEMIPRLTAAAPQGGRWDQREVDSKWASQGRAAAKMGPASLDGVGTGSRASDGIDALIMQLWRPTQAGEAVAAPPPVWRMHSWDDVGNAERVETMFGPTLRWLDDTETWAVYDGARWIEKKKDEGGARIVQRMIDTLPTLEAPLYSEAPDPNDTSKDPKSQREAFLSFVKQQRFTAKVRAGSEMVRIRGELSTTSKAFDASPDLFNVANGVLNLREGMLYPHAPERMQRRISPISYDPTAVAPTWEAFLERVHPDPDVRDYLQRAVGYSLTGHTREQAFFLHHGSTSNGKSVFLRVMEAILGEFSQVIPGETLLQKRESQHPTDIDRMDGRRFLQLSETRKGARFDDAVVKRLTGEETVTARGMGKDFREFRITGKVHVVTNHPPHGGDDPAVARRLRVIRWGVTIPEHERDHTLGERIIEHELPGVLAWAVRGAARWYEIGLGEPVQIRMETEGYIHEEDVFAQWMEERGVERRDNVLTATDALFVSYDAWCKAGGLLPMNKITFGKELGARGFTKRKSGSIRGWGLTSPTIIMPD